MVRLALSHYDMQNELFVYSRGLKEQFSPDAIVEMGQIDTSRKTPVSNPFAINLPSAHAIVNPARDTQPVTNFDIHPPTRKGEHRYAGTEGD